MEKISTALFKGVVTQIHGDFWRIYEDCMDDCVNKMNEVIYVEQPEKSYNIVMSMIRLTLKENNSIGRYKQKYITSLEIAPKLLSCGLKDYNLDVAIERALDEITLP